MTDDLTHYMEATSLLKAENEILLQRARVAETALRHLWTSLAWSHRHSAGPGGCQVCDVHDEVRRALALLGNEERS